MFLLILLLSIPTEIYGADLKSLDAKLLFQWSFFKEEYKKVYSGSEDRYRLGVFLKNVDMINAHNERATKGLETFTMGINKFSDMTFSEFSSKYLGARRWYFDRTAKHLADPNEQLPFSVDWREKGIVGPIKDQGACGSCWAFSTISAIESAYAQAEGNTTSLSEQNLMDCSWLEGNLGCNGGFMTSAYRTITRLGGIMASADYPYTGRDSIICKYSQSKAVLGVKSYVLVEGTNNMKSAVAMTNVAASMEVDERFQHYKEGVFSSSGCQNTASALNHAVNLVGYGKMSIPVDPSKTNTTRDDETKEIDYWIMRNSWSTSWGENGYCKIQTGQCGIEMDAVYPVLKLHWKK